MFPHSSAILPILLWKPKGGHPTQVGSCVYVRVGTSSVLITAAHVLDWQAEGTLCIPSGTGVKPFAGSLGSNVLPEGIRRAEDKTDLGFLVPTPEVGAEIPPEYAPLAPANIDLTGNVQEGEFCLVAGFPLSRKWAKHDGKSLSGSRLNFVGIAFGQRHYTTHGYNSSTHVLIEYHLDKAIYPEGDRANAPNPRGMSGGGVFRIGQDLAGKPDSSNAQLVGVFQEFIESKNMFVGIRIREALRLFVESLPPHVRQRVEA